MNWTVFGAGNFILDIVDAIETNGGRLTFVVINKPLPKEVLSKIPKNATIIPIKKFRPRTTKYFFGFVDPKKETLLKFLSPFGITFANLIHKKAYVAKHVKMGQGNFIGAGAVVGPGVKLGNFNTVNRMASLGHEVIIGNGNHIGPGCTISGRCNIGNKNFFGAGSTIIDGIEVGNKIVLGAGAVLVQNATKSGTYVGVPAKKK